MPQRKDKTAGLIGLALVLVAMLSLTSVSVSLAAFLSPEEFLGQRASETTRQN